MEIQLIYRVDDHVKQMKPTPSLHAVFKENELTSSPLILHKEYIRIAIVATELNPTSLGETQLFSRIYLRAKDDINYCQESPLYLTRKPSYTLFKTNSASGA